MYSGNNNTESSSKLKHCQQKPNNVYMEDSEEKKMKRRQTKRNYVAEKDNILTSPELNKEQKNNSKKGEDLSRDDLLFLLSVLEGELQAQDEVIGVLKAEKINLALLEGQYGFVTPKKVLEALQRDAIQAKTTLWQEDIYEKPMGELDKLVEKHKETHRRMLGQLLMVEKSHRQTLYDLEDEKRKHSEYMEKSDEFTNLLEQEQERLKKLLEQDAVYQAKREKENCKKINKLKEELIKLKSFTLMLVDEQQRLTEELSQQTEQIQDLTTSAEQAHEKISTAESKAQEQEQKALRLEGELQTQIRKASQEQEATMAKLTNEESQHRQLRLKLTVLSRQVDELEETNKSLRKAEEELQDLRDKINRGECGNSTLMSEVELLRKRVLEMEGKDEELIKLEEQCRELHKRLEKEATQSKNFKVEVDKLNKRIMELEKLEDAFTKSKQECSSLKCNLEKEKTLTKQLSLDLDGLKARIGELETTENKLEKTEFILKEDLSKLKSLTVMLVDERKTMNEKIKQMEEKVQTANLQLQLEQKKVMSVTEKLIEESKKALKFKNDAEEKMTNLTRERDELKNKLKTEEEKGNDLSSKMNLLRKKLQSLETIEKEFLKNKLKETTKPNPTFQQENNKIKELVQEIEKLKYKLKEMKAIEDDLMKTEDEFESLERRYVNEQDKARFLSEELEIVKRELARYKLAEKTECNHEQRLFRKLKEETAKSGHLSREVDALKEKIHEYMATEDLICHLREDQRILQKKLTQQENKNKELGREMETLNEELQRYRRFSKSLRPSLNGRRISDLQVASKEVQTEPADNEPPDYKSLVPLERAVINGHLYEESDNEDDDNDDESMISFSNSSIANVANNSKLWIPWMKSKESHIQNGRIYAKQNGNCIQPGNLVLSHTPGQPLHIKVTPDHEQNTAMLEITSPTSVNSHSFTSTAVIPNCGTAKQRITIIQNESLTPIKSKLPDVYPAQEQAMAPLTMTTFARSQIPESCASVISERTMSPLALTSRSSPEQLLSPVSLEMIDKHTVFKVSPERQSSVHFQRSNSSNSNVITTEDNKIHIHLGNPYAQTISNSIKNNNPCTPVQDNRTPNGTPSKSVNKITSSITITPTATSLPRQSQITIADVFRQAIPIRNPKSKTISTTVLPVRTPSGQ